MIFLFVFSMVCALSQSQFVSDIIFSLSPRELRSQRLFKKLELTTLPYELYEMCDVACNFQYEKFILWKFCQCTQNEFDTIAVYQ